MSKSSRTDVELVHNFDLFVPTRTLFITGQATENDDETGIDIDLATRTIKNLHILESASQGEINIIINNSGGSTSHGMAIYDYIRMCSCFVNITVVGNALSMAAWILQAADKRMASKHACILLHSGKWAVPDDHPENCKNAMKQLEREELIFEDILLEKIKVKYPKFTRAAIKKLIYWDQYLSSSDALNLNLIDEIV